MRAVLLLLQRAGLRGTRHARRRQPGRCQHRQARCCGLFPSPSVSLVLFFFSVSVAAAAAVSVSMCVPVSVSMCVPVSVVRRETRWCGLCLSVSMSMSICVYVYVYLCLCLCLCCAVKMYYTSKYGCMIHPSMDV